MKDTIFFLIYFVGGIVLMFIGFAALAFADSSHWYHSLFVLIFGIIAIVYSGKYDVTQKSEDKKP